MECPRCKNEDIKKNQNYCQICGLDLKVRTALESPVQKQSNLDLIMGNQVEILQLAQERCLKNGSFEIVNLIAKTLINIAIQFQNYRN